MAIKRSKKLPFSEGEKPGKKNYPELDGAEEIVDDFLTYKEEAEFANAKLKRAKGEITTLGTPAYFEACNGKADNPSSIVLKGNVGDVMLVFTSRYSESDREAEIEELLGEEPTGELFEERIKISIDSRKIPPEKCDAFLAGLIKLAEKHGAESAITSKAVIAPKGEFHTIRHREFDADTNVRMQEICPCVVQVKEKK